MTSPAPLHTAGHPNRLDGECFALSRELHQVFGGADDGIEPIQLLEALGAEDQTNIVAVRFDLAAHLGDLVFRQAECVWGFDREFQHSHCNFPARFVANTAKGKLGTALTCVASELSLYPVFYEGSRAQVDSIFKFLGEEQRA